MPGGENYYKEPKDYIMDETREITRKSLLKEAHMIVNASYIKNSKAIRCLRDMIIYLER